MEIKEQFQEVMTIIVYGPSEDAIKEIKDRFWEVASELSKGNIFMIRVLMQEWDVGMSRQVLYESTGKR